MLHSVDEAMVEGDVDSEDAFYPVEFLNNITASGLPLSKLRLKIGVPLMILRNLNPQQGLCNGTRCILLACTRRVLKVQIIRGQQNGDIHFIPRIDCIPEEESVGFQFRRRQFPVRLAFAMTINKSQGQSVKNVGIDLSTPVFSHGQLYVALSRCTSASSIHVLLPEVMTAD